MSTAALGTAAACGERARLLTQYAIATEQYHAAALRELQVHRATISRADYEELHRGVEQARRFADRARNALHRHVTEHHCGSNCP